MDVNFRGLNRLAAKFRKLENPDYAPLMAAWSTLSTQATPCPYRKGLSS
jgi:hypothetical protein